MPKTVENLRTRQTGIILKTHSYYMSQMEANLKILGRPIFDRSTHFCKNGSGGGVGVTRDYFEDSQLLYH